MMMMMMMMATMTIIMNELPLSFIVQKHYFVWAF